MTYVPLFPHEWLQRIALTTDDAFPENEDIRIEQGRPIIRKVRTDPKVEGLDRQPRFMNRRNVQNHRQNRCS